jgi:hypothetical protein
MNADEFIVRYQARLKGLSPDKQAELIEEIGAHLEEGQFDVRLGADPTERTQRLMQEMGTPEDMGRRMQNIHHHNRWIDYCLVVVPLLIFSPLISMVLIWLSSGLGAERVMGSLSYYWSIRILFLIHFALIMIGYQRYRRFGDPGLVVYWLAETLWGVVAICMREQRWLLLDGYNRIPSGKIETFFWVAVLAGLGIGLFRIIARSKDPLIAVLGFLPFSIALGNLVTGQMMTSGSFPNGYHMPYWVLGYFGPTQISLVVWPALFFLFRQRQVRWLGLLANAAPLALMNLVASVQYPGLVFIWSLPLLLVLAGWVMDVYNRPNRKAVVG